MQIEIFKTQKERIYHPKMPQGKVYLQRMNHSKEKRIANLEEILTWKRIQRIL